MPLTKRSKWAGAQDQPIVGDWDGDGIDEPGLYTESPNAPEFN